VLSQQPLTLKMLLHVYRTLGALPGTRSELFAKGVELLASEPAERFEDGTAIDVPLAVLLDAATRMACIALLSGREVFDLGDSPYAGSLGWLELAHLPGGSSLLDRDLLREVSRCGLCDADGPRRFRFAHRQFAEFLAGRRLSTLLLHQARSLLGSGLGWQAGVAGPLRETAAFAAIESPAIAEWVTECDPEVIGRCSTEPARMTAWAFSCFSRPFTWLSLWPSLGQVSGCFAVFAQSRHSLSASASPYACWPCWLILSPRTLGTPVQIAELTA
jgi:hypothetical protein